MTNNSAEIFKETLSKDIDSIVEKLQLIDDAGWEKDVKKVLVIVSASRSGSSLLFKFLSNNSNFIALTGEHEPWLILSKNKFPFTHSDQIHTLSNRETLLQLIRNDMYSQQGSVNETAMSNRTLIHPADEPPLSINDISSNTTIYPYENPPYIPAARGKLIRRSDISNKTLLFKSPSDAYRPNLFETLFPEAEISYIHLTRGFAQTVNGLMDGWQQLNGDFISNGVGLSGIPLTIEGLEKNPINKNYWRFDMFPSWQDYISSNILDICVSQWYSAHQSIIDMGIDRSRRLPFELVHQNKHEFSKILSDFVGFDVGLINTNQNVMSTHPPKSHRWRKRQDVFLNITDNLPKELHEKIQYLQYELGYNMEPSTWH